MNSKSLLRYVFRKDRELNKKTIESLETDQKEMIQGIVELSETTVREVMVPRIDTVFISVDENREDLLAKIIESGHSRFPVYEETIDKVIGILYAKDVLRSLVKNEASAGALARGNLAGDPAGISAEKPAALSASSLDLRSLARKPFFVPESKYIDDLLRELRRRKVHIAIVVDEYGGVSGIVTMENIIEEIIGDIQDEFDNEKEDFLDQGGGVWLCDARVNLDDLSEHIGIKFPAEDFDTLGGFVFDLFGKIPVKYEKQIWEGHEFIIQSVEGHKINTVKIVLGRKEE